MSHDPIAVTPVLIGDDNYSYLLRSGTNVAVVDPSFADPVLSFVDRERLKVVLLLATHHHSDHVAGIKKIKDAFKCVVISGDPRTPAIDRCMGESDSIDFDGTNITILSVPGHTKKHVAFYLAHDQLVFTGDTLFGAGCGRIFEGSPEQMYNSLQKLSSLPDNTSVYFGHEYTLENLRFAVEMEPDNDSIHARLGEVTRLYAEERPTTPSTIGLEKRTNPFLRCDSRTIRQKLKMVGRSPIAVFTELRRLKNSF